MKKQHKIFSGAARKGRLWLVGFIILMVSSTVSQTYAQTLNMWWVSSSTQLDLDALRTKFPTVIVNGIVHTSNVGFNGIESWGNPAYTMYNLDNLPTSVSGYAGIDLVRIDMVNFNDNSVISQTRTDALIAYIKQGGILIGNIEGIRVGNTSGPIFNKYLGEALLTQPGVNISANAPYSAVSIVLPPYHGGAGTLGLTGSAPSILTGSTASTYLGIPSESIVYSDGTPSNPGQCGTIRVLDFIALSYPGGTEALSAGTNGFAYLTGEGGMGALEAAGTRPAGNPALTALIYDFLHDPSAMSTRRTWSQYPANVNPNCPVTTLGDCIPPIINSITPATQTVDVGGTATALTVSATGSGTLSYQWYSNITNSNAGGTAIPGATSATYNPSTAAAGTRYYM